MEELQGFLASHWPGLVWMVISMMATQVLKNSIFTKRRAHFKSKAQWFWWWGYKTLPVHMVLLGFILGVFWQNPENSDPVWPLIASVMYFGCFGGLSVWAFEAIKGLAKQRGIDLGNLPGSDEGGQ